MNERHATAHEAAVAALDDRRYFRLLDALDRLVSQPPLASTARTTTGRRPRSVRCCLWCESATPADPATVLSMLEAELNAPPTEIFASFDTTLVRCPSGGVA